MERIEPVGALYPAPKGDGTYGARVKFRLSQQQSPRGFVSQADAHWDKEMPFGLPIGRP
jgi:hypothetical protein